jgi:hypothetical protein
MKKIKKIDLMMLGKQRSEQQDTSAHQAYGRQRRVRLG